MTTAQMLACLLYQKDQIIREKDITIRHLKALLADQDAELAARERYISELMGP